MTKKLNKHTPTSEELFKRLDENNSVGLDDFEKEALEGFASLEDNEQARQLNAKLDAKIHEVYFEEKKSKRPFFYLSLAAGLVFVVGLSIFFYTFLNNQKQELALNKETVQNEVLPDQQAAPPLPSASNELKQETEDSAPSETATGKGYANKDVSDATKKEGKLDESLVATKSTTNKNMEIADREADALKPSEEANNGPGTVASAPVVIQEQSKLANNDKELSSKSAPAKDLDEAKPRSTVPMGGLKKRSAKSEASSDYKQKEKIDDEITANTLSTSEPNAKPSLASELNAGGASGETRKENGLLMQPVFIAKNFNKAQDYIKTEIDKNATLKNNVKEFTAKLTINENGVVSKVKFISAFANCATCEKELETILLKMPNWQAATQGGKKVKETIHFLYP